MPKVDEREKKGGMSLSLDKEEATMLLTGISERMMSPFATSRLRNKTSKQTSTCRLTHSQHPDTKTRLFSFEKDENILTCKNLLGTRTVSSQESKQQHMGQLTVTAIQAIMRSSEEHEDDEKKQLVSA